MTRSQPADQGISAEQFDAMMQRFRDETRGMFSSAHVASIVATARTTRELNNAPAPAENEQGGNDNA